jgi:hypothetical protein
MRTLASILVACLVAAAGAGLADARRPTPPTVDLGSSALLAPDGGSIATSVVASCADGSTVLRATVTVTQAHASGSGSFALACIGPFPRVFPVTVAATSGTFSLGPAQATATVVVQRGRVQEAQSSTAVQLEPAVTVSLADAATLSGGGEAVSIGVTVACAPGPSGLDSYVAVSQGNVIGRGFYVPVCDGTPHTFTVTAVAAQGTFQAGEARALSFADVTWNGSFFAGVGEEPVQLVA